MKTLNSNEDLIIDLMNYSPHGAVCQAFIMTALQHYCEAVIKKPISGGGFVSPELWTAIAKDIKTRMDAFYSRHDQKEEA